MSIRVYPVDRAVIAHAHSDHRLAVRFPRIVRWRQDKLAESANIVDDLKKLIETHGI